MEIRLRPELEELIKQDVQRGPYETVDEFVEHAVSTARAGWFRRTCRPNWPRLFHLGFEVLHNLRMLLGNIGGFADVVGQVVKFFVFNLAMRIRHWHTVGAARFTKADVDP